MRKSPVPQLGTVYHFVQFPTQFPVVRLNRRLYITPFSNLHRHSSTSAMGMIPSVPSSIAQTSPTGTKGRPEESGRYCLWRRTAGMSVRMTWFPPYSDFFFCMNSSNSPISSSLLSALSNNALKRLALDRNLSNGYISLVTNFTAYSSEVIIGR